MREAMLIVHFVGLAMGLGTSLGFLFLGIASSKMPPEEGAKFRMNIFALSKMGHIGLALLILSGIYLLIDQWNNVKTNPLFIAKISLVVVLAALIGIISAAARKAKATGDASAMAKVAPLGRITLLIALTIVVLAVLVFH